MVPGNSSDIAQAITDTPHDDGSALVLSTDHTGPTILVYTTLDHGLTVIDITLGDQPDDQNEPRDAEPELVRRGFTPIVDDSDENVMGYRLRFDAPPVTTTIADLCETAFAVLGSTPSADITITRHEFPGISALGTLLAEQRAAPWHHDSASTIPAPFVVFFASFGGTSFEGFDHEADVVLGYLGALVDAGLPGELAREGLRAYRPLWPDLFAAGWERAYPTGFPDVELDPQYDLTLPCSGGFLHHADLRIPGVGYGAGSPASGDFLVVADSKCLDELRCQMQGRYIIHELDPSDYWGGPFGIPLERIEQARSLWRASASDDIDLSRR